jgi:hypothetical protein
VVLISTGDEPGVLPASVLKVVDRGLIPTPPAVDVFRGHFLETIRVIRP